MGAAAGEGGGPPRRVPDGSVGPDAARGPLIPPDEPGGRERSCPVLVGPTAIGKTALIIALARRHPIEVINLDSRQIYRGLRIGAAQPDAEERAACPHHLVDFVPPDQPYSAARFRRDFATAWRDIVSRGRTPILAGGAGLYLEALRKGFFRLEGVGEQDVQRVRGQLAPLSGQEIRSRLLEVDPASWHRIHPRDRYRSQRSLEIALLAGRPMSELAAEQMPDPALGLAFPTVVLVRPTAELDARIRTRTQHMLAVGLIEETAALLDEYGPDAPGLRSVGYRQVVEFLRGELPRERLEDAIVLATRQLAKRQRTWFRHIERAAVGHPDDEVTLGLFEKLVERAGEG